MEKPKEPYHYVNVENYVPASAAGRHGRIHTRPLPGQGFSINLNVQVPAGIKKYPAGTKFRILAKVSDPKGGKKYLKSYHNWDFEVLERPRRHRLHIVHGDIEHDKRELEQAAPKNKSISRWTVPKSAAAEDEVIIFVSGYGFFATARIKNHPASRVDWKNRYGAGLTDIKLITPPISLSAIRRHIPKLTWANYPRSIHTPSPSVANHIRKLIQNRRRLGVPDLDDRSLTEAGIDELRKVALLDSRQRVPGVKAETVTRARSRAIHLYVLRRANGQCEGCKARAPFFKSDGLPYLEPHHTTRLKDDGPDHPANVIALCPNCHRRAHSSKDRKVFNERLKKALKHLEQ